MGTETSDRINGHKAKTYCLYGECTAPEATGVSRITAMNVLDSDRRAFDCANLMDGKPGAHSPNSPYSELAALGCKYWPLALPTEFSWANTNGKPTLVSPSVYWCHLERQSSTMAGKEQLYCRPSNFALASPCRLNHIIVQRIRCTALRSISTARSKPQCVCTRNKAISPDTISRQSALSEAAVR